MTEPGRAGGGWIEAILRPRGAAALVFALCLGLLGFGLYLQHGLGLEPCPMCIVQRYALVLIAVCAVLAGLASRRIVQRLAFVALGLLCVALLLRMRHQPPKQFGL
jgi:disulfide bond formation protein DsbB